MNDEIGETFLAFISSATVFKKINRSEIKSKLYEFHARIIPLIWYRVVIEEKYISPIDGVKHLVL